MPRPMMDQKENYKCAVRVIETEFRNKCIETLKKYHGRLSVHGLQRLYHNIKSKAENDDVQMGLNVEIVPRPSLDVSLDSVSSGSSFEGFQNVQNVASSLNPTRLVSVGKINYKKCKVSSAPVSALISSTEYIAIKTNHGSRKVQ